ncbi:unnamed protein product, partial [Ascophyllum nodosum]
SAEQDFAGEEPEAVGEDLAGGEPSAEDSPDGLAEQGTTWARASGGCSEDLDAFIFFLNSRGTSCTGNAGPISPAAAQDKTAA